MPEFKVNESYKKEIKRETIKSILIMSKFYLIVLPIIFIEYWYFAIIIGMIPIPFMVKSRWKLYKKDLYNLEKHKLTLNADALELEYDNVNTLYNLKKLIRLDFNTKKGCVDSIKLSFSGGFDFVLSQYEKMDKIETILKKKVNQQYIKYHRWFYVV